MLIEQLRARITEAVKAKDEVVRDVLRLAVGEIQTAEARASRALRDDEAAAIVKKLVKSNEETLALSGEGSRALVLRKEIAALEALLPKGLSISQIAEALAPVADAIRAAKGDGQATGIAMKHLKGVGASVDGNDVAAAVKTLRT
jgi:uncharacterized protein